MKLQKNLILLAVLAILVVVALATRSSTRQTPPAGDSMFLRFDQQDIQAPVGKTFTTTLKVRPSKAIKLSGYTLDIGFDKTKMTVSDIAYKLGDVSTGLGDDNGKIATVNQSGVVHVQGELHTVDGMPLEQTNEYDIVTITFTSLSSKNSSILVSTKESAFFNLNSDFSLSPIPLASSPNLKVN